jgi:hypothetical protein
MIKVGIYFDEGTIAAQVVDSLVAVSAELRPGYFSSEEEARSSEDVVADAGRFASFREANPEGYFLIGPGVLYSLNQKAKSPASLFLYCESPISIAQAHELFVAVSAARPSFGFAANSEEYRHRNRLSVSFDDSDIEAWVGRDPTKQVPGLYWMTLLSKRHCNEHGVDIVTLVNERGTHGTWLSEDLCVLTLFEKDEHWQTNAERLDDLCERYHPGIFSIRSIRKSAEKASDFIALQATLSKWK